MVPSAAIVFAASGYFEAGNIFSKSSDQTPATVATAPIAAPQIPAALVAPVPKPEIVARQEVLGQELSTSVVQTAPLSAVTAAPAPPRVTPETVRAPAQVQQRVPLPAPVFDTTQFAASSDLQQQCVEDLRKLTEAARVYFPSGGVTAEQSGIEQGNVIGLIAQSCPGVRIVVQGHSDASGDPAANLRLSQRRAEEVIRRIAASGVDTSKFVAEGIGDRAPSGLRGPQPPAYYDRRVEFAVVEEDRRVAARGTFQAAPWAGETCVAELQAAAQTTALFYAPRSVSLQSSDVNIAMNLAEMAAQCPYARLRVIGHHSNDIQARESTDTGRLRAKALMAMLVGRGVPSEQIIIASPSRPGEALSRSGLPGGRVSFDVILEDG